MDNPNRNRLPLSGEVPSPVNVPGGCSFHARCSLAFDRCSREQPKRREEVHSARIACLLPSDLSPT
ncbi:MAG: oligopeptide/dipeptide ABC transporter ATP-binding protein [Granulosicoccus sp.]